MAASIFILLYRNDCRLDHRLGLLDALPRPENQAVSLQAGAELSGPIIAGPDT